jgi:hypothetical protein
VGQRLEQSSGRVLYEIKYPFETGRSAVVRIRYFSFARLTELEKQA